MNDEQMERYMQELKAELPINESLKAELRSTFISKRAKQRRRFRWSKVSAVLLIVCVLTVFSTVWLYDKESPRVEAASLHFLPSFSLMQQLGKEKSSGMAEYKGTIYIPQKNKGLYAYDESSFYRLVEGDINFVRVSPNGEQLVYVQGGGLYLYDLKSKLIRLLLKGATAQDVLATPAWSPDGKRILYVNKKAPLEADADQTEESAKVEGLIAEINIAKGTIKEIAEGAYPSYLVGQNAIVYEKNSSIILRSLDDGDEKVLDKGQFPSVSNDGAYIAYIKTEGELELQDVWIADSDFKTKKKATNNSLSNAWDRKTGEMIEGKQQPRYTFEEPVWSSDSSQLFIYKVFHTNVVWKEMMQIKLSQGYATPEEIVAGSIQALIYRDEEYAHSFFSYDPGYLKGTSPRQVGYNILGSGQEEGKEYVDAETYLSYYDPYYLIITQRYWLSKGTEGYLIDDMVELNSQTLTKSGENVVLTVNDQSEQKVFAVKDIPEAPDRVNGDINNLVFQQSTNTVFMTLNRKLNDDNELVLFKYERDSKQFTELTVFEDIDHSSLMIIDTSGKYIAIQAMSEGIENTLVYSMEENNTYTLSDEIAGEEPVSVNTRFWSNGLLTYYVETDDRDVFFTFDPKSKKQ